MSSTKSFRRNYIRVDKTPKDVAIFSDNPTIEGLRAAIESIRTRPSKKNELQKREVFLILIKNILQNRFLLVDKQDLLETLISTNEFIDILTNVERYDRESYNHFKNAILYKYTLGDNDGRFLLLNLILIELCNRNTPYSFISYFILTHRDILDINTQNRNGVTALMYADLNNNDDLLTALLTLRPDITIQDTDCGRTALHYATDASVSRHIFNKLIYAGAGADVNTQDIVGNTPLHILMYTCSIFPDIAKIRILIHFGANLRIKNALGYTAFDLLLNLCTATGEIENMLYKPAIKEFIDAGADRNTSIDLHAHLVHPMHRDDVIKCIESNHLYNFRIQYVGIQSIDWESSPTNTGVYRIYGLYPHTERLIGEMRIKHGFRKEHTQLNEITIRFKDLTDGEWHIFDMGTRTVMAGGKRTKIQTRRRK